MHTLKTLSDNNQFRFPCPVFGAEVRLSECVSLRHTVTVGKRPEQRRGCQACMAASKCPMIRMFQGVHRTGEDPGMFSAEPRVGQLNPELLDHIAPIVVSEHWLDQYGVPSTERELILAANERTSTGKGRARAKPAPIALEAVSQDEAAPRTRARAKAEPDAAVTGDMGAAITKAMQRAAEAPESPAQADPAPAAVVAAPVPATPPVAAPAKPKPVIATTKTSDFAKTPAKPMSLLEIARQRRAEKAA